MTPWRPVEYLVSIAILMKNFKPKVLDVLKWYLVPLRVFHHSILESMPSACSLAKGLFLLAGTTKNNVMVIG